MLLGPEGDRAILDLLGGGLIVDCEAMSAVWGSFLNDRVRDGGCEMQNVPKCEPGMQN